MSISKTTSVTFLTSNGAEYSTLTAAKYREMADLFLSLFVAAGVPTNNVSNAGATILGKYFIDINGATLSSINSQITTARSANP